MTIRQPGARRSLQQLEQHLGARLFNRTTRQISLTDIGGRYYAFCSKILSEIEEEEVAVSRQQTQPKGSLRLLRSEPDLLEQQREDAGDRRQA